MKKTTRLTESAMLMALAVVLEIVGRSIIPPMPFGGQLTLVSMLPIVLMTYLAGGVLPELGGAQIGAVLLANGWTPLTAVCFLLFSLLHWPCSTTVLTVYRETKSLRWTALAVALPTLLGCLCCAAVAAFGRLML